MSVAASRHAVPSGVSLRGRVQSEYESILSSAALEFLAKLTRTFRGRIEDLLSARVEAQDAIAALRQRFVMGHEDQRRRGAAIQLEHQLHDVAARAAVEVTRGLVRKQDSRLRCKGPRNGHALLLSAGQLRRVVSKAVAQADLVDDAQRRVARILTAGELERQHDVFQRVERRHEVKRLKHEADALGADARAPVLVQLAEIRAVEFDISLRWQVEPCQQGQQGRLAGSGRAHDCDRLAGHNAETDVRQNGQTTLRTANLFADGMRRKNRGAFG